jgi:HAD superfamily hydrolase (TIGR01459 family)
MTQILDRISNVASNYDVIVLDQYGVLHDGTSPYAGAIECLINLATAGSRLAVLSNSGKRSTANAARISDMGFAASLFDVIMTSGEALWNDISSGTIIERSFLPVESLSGDAMKWAHGLDIQFEDSVKTAEAVLLMGLPDGHSTDQWQGLLDQAFAAKLPIYCSNPDLLSPRAGAQLVMSPGALAQAYVQRGGRVVFYGKPHRVIFDGLKKTLGAQRLLMVGDSLKHDIAGGQAAGWDTLLVRGGLYAKQFQNGDHDTVLRQLVTKTGCQPPTYSIDNLK